MFLLVCSKNSAASDDVNKEVHIAKDSKKPIIPFLLSGKWDHAEWARGSRFAEDYGYLLSNVQAIDGHPLERGVERLAKDILGRIDAAPPPVPFPRLAQAANHLRKALGELVATMDEMLGSRNPKA